MMEESKLVAESTEAAAPADSVEGVSAAAAEDSVAISDPAAQLAALAAERDQMAAEKSAMQDLLQRRQAEFENYRRRVEREKAESIDYGRMDTVLAILPVVDDFERGLKVESTDREFARGMELIYQRLVELLKKLGLEAVDAAGRKFDPNVHHAVQKQETAEAEEDTVLEEYQRGYWFRGRLLRPAMVKVAVRPAAAQSEE